VSGPGKPLKLGIIGCGKVAEERHLPALKMIPEVEVVAAADIDIDRARLLMGRFDIDCPCTDYLTLLGRPDVQAVAVLTPTLSHAEIGVAALDAGKHVFLEKPLALTLDQCDQLIAAAERSPAKIVVGFNLRWHRLVRRARAFIQTGDLGTITAIRSVYSHYRQGEDAPVWHRKRELGGGVTINEGVHHFDLWRYLLNSEVAEIFSIRRPSQFVEDSINIISASMTNGVLATAVLAFKTGPTNEVEIYGEAGRLYLSCYRFDGLEFHPGPVYPGDIRNRLRRVLGSVKDLPRAVQAMRRGGDFAATFYEIWRHFLDCVHENIASECTLEDGKRAVQIALAAIDSSDSGLPSKIEVDS